MTCVAQVVCDTLVIPIRICYWVQEGQQDWREACLDGGGGGKGGVFPKSKVQCRRLGQRPRGGLRANLGFGPGDASSVLSTRGRPKARGRGGCR
ncbi:hypothetical protein HPB47_009272 [Ixodes persulcatus]|uniref:Uncharacterized protein n=1 Tax=Ixodes persulcatus TaxID=34615 RepID=A0AC60P2H0_IXOPE|nr:hypothetical protein HPB47_009272 [Ixodes persulcatus]